jgi:hypothetical protein
MMYTRIVMATCLSAACASNPSPANVESSGSYVCSYMYPSRPGFDGQVPQYNGPYTNMVQARSAPDAEMQVRNQAQVQWSREVRSWRVNQTIPMFPGLQGLWCRPAPSTVRDTSVHKG